MHSRDSINDVCLMTCRNNQYESKWEFTNHGGLVCRVTSCFMNVVVCSNLLQLVIQPLEVGIEVGAEDVKEDLIDGENLVQVVSDVLFVCH